MFSLVCGVGSVALLKPFIVSFAIRFLEHEDCSRSDSTLRIELPLEVTHVSAELFERIVVADQVDVTAVAALGIVMLVILVGEV